MTRPQHTKLNELLPGMQHAFFDTVWPAFSWIQSIWIKEIEGQFHFFVVLTQRQNEKEWEDFEYLTGEVLKAVQRSLDELEYGTNREIKYTIGHGPTIPSDDGYQELMSDRVFKAIAEKHAPWRLEDGR